MENLFEPLFGFMKGIVDLIQKIMDLISGMVKEGQEKL